MINHLVASINGISEEKYVNSMETLLSSIEKIEDVVFKLNKKKVDLEKVLELKSLITSLVCYSFNNKSLPEIKDRLRTIENTIDKIALKEARKMSNMNCTKELRPFVKYVCWGKYYNEFGKNKLILNKLLDAGLLWKDENDNVLVNGLHLKVGDNTFSVKHGTRGYLSVVEPMAIYLSTYFTTIAKSLIDEIPKLPKIYGKYNIANGGGYKGCPKCYLSYEDKQNVINFIYYDN